MRILFLLLLFATKAFAQIEITGQVKDMEHKPLPGVNVFIKQVGSSTIMSFGSTKADGTYSIKIKSVEVDSLVISTSKMGFATQERRILVQSQKVDFVLEKGDIILKEVQVKAPPIRRYGDTLSYKVADFQSAGDRSIGDVIAKLPGIEIGDNGQIKYQGKPINRYYTEGLNLVDGRYGLVNNNLPPERVASVEIMENHQPIRILDSLQISESAALNIKFKSKITKSGTLHYGLGAKPLLFDINLTPMVFVPNLQFLGSFQANNTGSSVSKQFGSHFSISSGSSTKQAWLSVPRLSAPPFSSHRWLDNHSYAGSINALKKNPKDLEMKINTSLILDRQERHGSSATQYLIGGESIGFSERTSNYTRKNEFSGSLELIKNTPKKYFTNRLEIDKEWQSDASDNARTDRLFEQNGKSDYLKINNHFNRIFTRKGLRYNLFSVTSYAKNNQNLQIDLSGADTLANPRQNFGIKDFNTHNYLELTKSFRSFSIGGRAGSQIGLADIETALENHPITEQTANHFAWNSFKHYVSPNFSYLYKKIRATLSLPLSHNHIVYNDKVVQQKRNFTKWVAEPRLTLQYKPQESTNLTASAGYQNFLARLGDIYSSYVMTDYLNVVQKDASFRDNHMYNAGVTFNHNQVTSGLSFNIRYNYSKNIQNLLAETRINPDASKTIVYREQENTGLNHSVGAGLSKYHFALKTSTSLDINYNQGTSQRFINDVFLTFTSSNIVPTARINFNGLKWLDLNYAYNYSYSKNSGLQEGVVQYNQRASVGFHAIKNTMFRFSFEHYNINTQLSSKNFTFGDIVLRYTLPKIKQDLELIVNNLFNQDSFQNITVSDYFTQQTTFQLRPRQFVVRGRIRL